MTPFAARTSPLLPTFDWPDLPVVAERERIAAAIAERQVVVLCGETGSGKTTQLPKICLAAGRGTRGQIGHTQPRRLAARTVAERIAEELNTPLGELVGYKIRFTDVGRRDVTRVKLMTDGILLAETRTDRDLRAYDTIILDEAHERSLNIDFLLGYLKRLLPRRPDLKLILTSATIDPQRFSRHFDDAPVIMVGGRTYPVETRYFPLAVDEREVDDSPTDAAAATFEGTAPPAAGDDSGVPPPLEGGGRGRGPGPDLTPVAQQLRHDATIPESKLWSRLRNQPEGIKFRRQQPIGPYVVDFYCPAAKVVIEVDGRSHDEFTADRDATRQAWLEAQGLRVLRYTNDDVVSAADVVAEDVLRVCREEPLPLPPPSRGGGMPGRASTRGGGSVRRDDGGRRDDRPEPDLTEQEGVVAAAKSLINEGRGDILAFLPTERDIRETADALVAAGVDADVLPLFGRLSQADQIKVFRPDGRRRRIVLATNVAETSVTVPGIHCVIDTGLARVSRYSPRTKVQRLPIEPVSRASADQRRGRCGRIAPGVCVRLFSEKDYDGRPAYTEPEILRTNLASVILQMKWLRLGRIEDFPFLDPPDARQVRDGLSTLHEIGAIDDHEDLTPVGQRLARLPVDVRVGRMIVGGQDEGCVDDVLVIAAALSTQDVRERPSDQQDAADQSHAKFRDDGSDFVSILKLWRTLRQKQTEVGSSQFRKWCRANFVSYLRFREWSDVHAQLRDLSNTAGVRGGRSAGELARLSRNAPHGGQARRLNSGSAPRDNSQAIRPVAAAEADEFPPARRDAVHRALLGGLVGNVAQKAEPAKGGPPGTYTAARGTKLTIWPGSALVKSRPPWLMSSELIETTRLYARTVAPVRPEWVERAARHLVKRTHTEPHYVKPTASVHAFERVTLWGLVLVPRRSVHLGPIDPVQSRQLFIQHALVLGEFGTDHPSLLSNRRRVLEVEALQRKLRRTDLLSEQAVRYAFFDAVVPAHVYSGPTFMQWARRGEGSNSHLLDYPDEVLLRSGVVDALVPLPLREGLGEGWPGYNAAEATASDGNAPSSSGEGTPFDARNPSPYPLPQGEGGRLRVFRETVARDFPDTFTVAGARLPLEYAYDPGDDRDGVTLVVPVAVLPQVRDERIEWPVPGRVRETIDALIRALPKKLRTPFVPVAESAAVVQGKLGSYGVGSFDEAVAGILWKLKGEPVTRADFQADHVPPHLRLNVRVVDANGQRLAEGRDLSELRAKLNLRVAETFTTLADPRFTKGDLKRWDFGDLPERVEIEQHGIRLYGYPALVEVNDTAALRLLDSQPTAAAMMPAGLRRLFMTETARELKTTLRDLPGLESLRLNYRPFGTGDELMDDLTRLTADRAFFDHEPARPTDVRTQIDFAAQAGRAWGRLHETSRHLGRLLTDVLTRHRTLSTLLHRDYPPLLVDSAEDMRRQLRRLLPKRFMSVLPGDKLEHLPRYLRGIETRLNKLTNAGLTRDLTGMTTLRPFQQMYDDADRAHARRGVVDPALAEFRWLLEELRISLFAQDIKTSVPVSPRRLEEAWKAVRMV